MGGILGLQKMANTSGISKQKRGVEGKRKGKVGLMG
jgi:hypothetical protein